MAREVSASSRVSMVILLSSRSPWSIGTVARSPLWIVGSSPRVSSLSSPQDFRTNVENAELSRRFVGEPSGPFQLSCQRIPAMSRPDDALPRSEPPLLCLPLDRHTLSSVSIYDDDTFGGYRGIPHMPHVIGKSPNYVTVAPR